MIVRHLVAATALVAMASVASVHAADATAAQEVTKACAANWKADKAAGKVKASQTWASYLSDCAKAGAAPVAAAPAAKADKPAKAAKTTKGETPAQQAEHARMRECGKEWRAAKAAGKTGKQTWPDYWSDCNKRLK